MSGDNLHKMSSSSSVSMASVALGTNAALANNMSMLSIGGNSGSSTVSVIGAASSLQGGGASASSAAGGGKFTTHTLSPLNHRYVKLNVGGRLFVTSIDTLTRRDNMLRAMFSGHLALVSDADGYVLVDRSGKYFEFILDFLRDEDAQSVALFLEDKSECELYELLREAKFYCVSALVALVEAKMASNKKALLQAQPSEPYLGSSVVSMVTSKSELNRILYSTEKVGI